MADIINIGVVSLHQPIHLIIASGGGDVPWYTGDTVVTPSRDTQILPTSGLRMPDNVTVNPIPSDWGHIIFSGYKLRVE